MAEDCLNLSAIVDARERIRGRVHRTPVFSSTCLGDELGLRLQFKAELFQKTGSFKIRGILNALEQMPAESLGAGLLSMSAGNAAAALAYGASIKGTRATVVMPLRAIPSKIEATRAYGGEVVLTESDLMDVVHELQRDRGLTFVHPFDDLRVMAGHGTIGLEILEDVPDVDAVIVPVGGGGLIGGIAAAVKSSRPDVKVIGVEPVVADGMTRALEAGHPVAIGHPPTVADGLAAPFAGEHTLRHVRRFVDTVLRVDDATIVEALRLVITRCKLAAEPSGAAPLAALLTRPAELAGVKRVVCVVSGGNVDPAALGRLLEG